MGTAATEMDRLGVLDGPHAGVNEMLRDARFVDHHVHSVRRGQLTRDQLVLGLSETDRQDAADVGGLDHQLGVALRRWCAPLVGLEPSVPADAWIEHRMTLENEGVAERILPLAGVERFLVDTGFRADELVPLEELGRLAGAVAQPVVRLETLAEHVASGGVGAQGFPGAFRDALHAAASGAVGLKSVIAYRSGFDVAPAAPGPAEVAVHAGKWMAGVESGGALRLVDPVLLRFLLWSAVETGLPLQIHAGYGDPDLDLHRSDPLLLTDFVRAAEGRCQIVLLHNYPYHRHAGYLAQMFAHVSMDIGLAINHTGAQSEQLIAETLEVAPFRKILFSSDAWGLPELHVLGSWLFRRGLSRVLGRWVVLGDWSEADAERAITLVGRENAHRIYGP